MLRAFAIFEGGGARGYAHVGALAALEELGIELQGVAGTSAGAIIAALVAVGHRADELFDPSGRLPDLLARHGITPGQVLARAGWEKVRRLRRALPRWLAGLIAGGVIPALLMAPHVAPLLHRMARRRGLLALEPIRHVLNLVLRERLVAALVASGPAGRAAAARLPARIRMADLDVVASRGAVLPLKIIATDLATGSLALFDAHTTPGVEVAEAVCASLAIPYLFEPATGGSLPAGQICVDGGLVSNLPIWAFAAEQAALMREMPDAKPVPVVAFELVTGRVNRVAPAPRPHLAAVLDAALGGGQSLIRAWVGGVTLVRLACPLDVLDLDAPPARIAGCIRGALREATAQLNAALLVRPRRLARALARVRGAVARCRHGLPAPGDIMLEQGPLVQLWGRGPVWDGQRLTVPVFRDPDSWAVPVGQRPRPQAALVLVWPRPLRPAARAQAESTVLPILISHSRRIGALLETAP